MLLRYCLQHKLIALLNILSIALGVAVYLAIQIANHSAFRAFRAGVDVVAGKSHLEVRAADGRLDEMLFPVIRSAPGVRAATPVCEGFVTLPDRPGDYLHVLGVDPFTNSEFQTASLIADSGGRFDPMSWFAQEGTLSIPRALAKELGVVPGDKIRAEIDGKVRELPVGFVIDDSDTPTGGRDVAMDIGWCQEIFGSAGSLASVHVILENPDDLDSARASLQALMPAGVEVTTPAARSRQIGLMLRGFRLNITALSMVSILVGMFLIYNTTSASVVPAPARDRYLARGRRVARACDGPVSRRGDTLRVDGCFC